jgi:glutamate dehydrogenase (NADP+)
MELKNIRRGRIKEYAEKFGVEYFEGKRPWTVKCDIALPCATENEINKEDAESLIKERMLPCFRRSKYAFHARGNGDIS